MKTLATLLATTFAIGLVCLTKAKAETPASTASSIYTVAVYDPKRSAEDDLKATLAKANTSGKRVLIQVGGDWCGWCHLMSKYFVENGKVSTALMKDYLVMKVNYSEDNRNKDFLSKYPKVAAYPHLFVLDTDGKVLHSQGTAVLEEGEGYSEKAVLEFLSKWGADEVEQIVAKIPTPPPVDARGTDDPIAGD